MNHINILQSQLSSSSFYPDFSTWILLKVCPDVGKTINPVVEESTPRFSSIRTFRLFLSLLFEMYFKKNLSWGLG